MNSEEKWSRRRAIEIHDATADGFFAEYRGDNIFDSPFRYGRHLINRAWARCVSELPPGATCLDIGCGVGAHMARLLNEGFKVTGIEPSTEMRRLATKNIPGDLVCDGSVLQLPASDLSMDFVYAIEVFRYLDTHDNAQGHREIVRVLKPGGIYFGTYVNKWALDGFRQLSQFRKFAERLTGTPRRYHVEFETPSALCDKLRAAGFSRVTAHGAMFAPLRVLHKIFFAPWCRRVEAHDAPRDVAFRHRTISGICRSLNHNRAALDISAPRTRPAIANRPRLRAGAAQEQSRLEIVG